VVTVAALKTGVVATTVAGTPDATSKYCSLVPVVEAASEAVRDE
jgi:hypothetical protein